MDIKVDEVISKMTEVKDLLSKFDDRDMAIEYLVKETKLSKEECSMAYDFYMGINSNK